MARSLWYHLRAIGGGLQPCHLGRVAQGIVVYGVGLDLPSLPNPQIVSKTGRWKQKNFWYSKVLPLVFLFKSERSSLELISCIYCCWATLGITIWSTLAIILASETRFAIRTWKLGTGSFFEMIHVLSNSSSCIIKRVRFKHQARISNQISCAFVIFWQYFDKVVSHDVGFCIWSFLHIWEFPCSRGPSWRKALEVNWSWFRRVFFLGNWGETSEYLRFFFFSPNICYC